eukprot:6874770-Alexandrium_andersonii.AAC.1
MSLYSLKGLSMYVMTKLDEHIVQYGHVLASTTRFVSDISRITPLPEHTFFKLDVKEYFMSGAMHELVRASLDIVENTVLKTLLTDALYLLLDQQFVESTELRGRLWKVVTGSGMGLPHSGSVCDAAMIGLFEKAMLADTVKKKY